MKVDIRKKFREVKWTTEHTLNSEQRNSLIMKKIERARKEVEVRNRTSKPELHV